ncbi:MAG TPA: EAL domain-containing protein [Rhodocyclaceae bacterium]|nr:EAL domain-containing protein [Rhodocyclaceae bacterium]
MTFARKVRWLLLWALLPVLLALGALFLVLYERERNNLQEDFEQDAREMSQRLDDRLLGVQRFLQALAETSRQFDAGDPAVLRQYLRATLSASGIADAIVVTDATGQQIVNTLLEDEQPLPRTRDMERVQQMFATGKPLISNLVTGTVARRPLVTVDVPVVRNGRVLYDLNAVLLSTRLDGMLQTQRMPAGWMSVIFDRTGTVAAQSGISDSYIGRKVIAAGPEPLAGQQAFFDTEGPEGAEITAAFARSEATGFGVALGVPKAVLLKQMAGDLALPLLAVLGALAASMFMIWRFGALLEGRRRSEFVVRAERERLNDILDTLPAFVALIDPDYRVRFVNRGYRERLGETGDRRCYEALLDRTEPCQGCKVDSLFARGGSDRWEWSGPNGHTYEVYGRAMTGPDGNPVVLQGGVDITERKAAEQTQARLNRSLRLVSECNAAIVHHSDETALLDAICGLMVTTGEYRMAWVGVAENDAGRTVRPVAVAGDDSDYLHTIRVSWGDNELGRGPTGTAVRLRQTQINQDVLTNPAMAPWREAALRRGYQSSIALPLANGETVIGVLMVYSSEAMAFQADEVKLLERLAADLAFGMVAIRTEEARLNAVAGQWAIEERYRLVLDNAADAVLVNNSDLNILYANREAAQLLGYEPYELEGRRVTDIVPRAAAAAARERFEHLRAQGHMRAELDLLCSDGRIVPVELNAVQLPGGDSYGSYRDITDRKRFEAELQYRATHDALTGLANRSMLADRIDQSIVHARRTGRLVAIMLLDLDRFKLINDSLGHEVGDAMLKTLALGLSASVRPGDTVARFGGDEFMIVAADLAVAEDAATVGYKLLDAVTQPLDAAGHRIVTTASLGISLFPRDGESSSDLIRNADVAMYRAKDLGRNAFQFYAPEMNARTLERLELEGELRRALAQGELELAYQPKVDLHEGRIVGAEALIRWRHPKRGMVSPGEFIPLAEETGLIVPIGQWVIETACAQIKRWRREGIGDVAIAVNISARQFQHRGLVDVIDRSLRNADLHGGFLDLEVTESAIMANPDETTRQLERLKGLGVSISLDDFGTGYSSLGYLKRFPIDCLKVDQSFVRDIAHDSDDAAIVQLVIALGHSLGHTVIAEGVETEGQLHFLRRNRCDQMQGYLFSRPVPAGDFAALVREDRRLATVH